jgi:hypothetical protein
MHPEILARFREGVDIDLLARDFPQEVMDDALGRVAEALDGNAAAFPAEQMGMPGGELDVAHEGADREDDENVLNPTAPQGDEESEVEDESVSYSPDHSFMRIPISCLCLDFPCARNAKPFRSFVGPHSRDRGSL